MNNGTNILEIIEKAQVAAPESFGDSETSISPTYTGAELYALNADSIHYLVDGVIPSTGIFTVVGASDTGKSMLLRQLAIDCVYGIPFLGWDINGQHRKALFIATEDDHLATAYLLRRQVSDPSLLQNLRFYFETDNILDYVDEQLEADSVDLVIIDAWSDVFGGNLNDSALIRNVLNQYRSLANKYNCAIGFLHHTGKRTEKLTPSKNNILSGQGYEAKMRLVIELRNDPSDDNIKHLCIVKGNYLPKDMKNSSFKLEFDPDTFRFTNTGERVDFDELGTLTEDGREQSKPLLKPFEVDADTHMAVLRSVFAGGIKPKRSVLMTRLSNHYERYFGTKFGGKRVESYFDHLFNDLAFIGKHGKDRSPDAYYYLTTDHPLATVVSGVLSTTDHPPKSL